MIHSRLRLATLALLVACAAKQSEPERPLPKPNIDPGRMPASGKEPSAEMMAATGMPRLHPAAASKKLS